MNHKLPYDKRQTYQIGDICRIVHANNEMRYPPIKDEETKGYGLLVQITGSYWQRCGTVSVWYDNNGNFLEWAKNLLDYSIIIPKHLIHNVITPRANGSIKDVGLAVKGLLGGVG